MREAIESVVAQTFQDWELLIVDDASRDSSAEIAREFEQKDARIHLLFNKNHTGIPSTPRNEGLRAAQGRYIAFIDSDDLWESNKLEQQLPLFTDKVAVVFSNYEKINENGERRQRIVTAPQKINYEKLLLSNVIAMVTGIYDTQLVGKIEFLDVHHEDYAMWLTILKKGFTARNTNSVTAALRMRKGSVSYNKLCILSWQWRIYRDVEHLPFFRSIYYYANYAVKGLLKSLV